jgi:hypothetical protein
MAGGGAYPPTAGERRGSSVRGHLGHRDLAGPDVRPARLRITDDAPLDQRVEVGAADANPPADMQGGELPLVDPLSGLPGYADWCFRSPVGAWDPVLASPDNQRRSRHPRSCVGRARFPREGK